MHVWTGLGIFLGRCLVCGLCHQCVCVVIQASWVSCALPIPTTPHTSQSIPLVQTLTGHTHLEVHVHFSSPTPPPLQPQPSAADTERVAKALQALPSIVSAEEGKRQQYLA